MALPNRKPVDDENLQEDQKQNIDEPITLESRKGWWQTTVDFFQLLWRLFIQVLYTTCVAVVCFCAGSYWTESHPQPVFSKAVAYLNSINKPKAAALWNEAGDYCSNSNFQKLTCGHMLTTGINQELSLAGEGGYR